MMFNLSPAQHQFFASDRVVIDWVPRYPSRLWSQITAMRADPRIVMFCVDEDRAALVRTRYPDIADRVQILKRDT